MKHFIRAIGLLAIVVILLATTLVVTPTGAAASVIVLSHTAYADSVGYGYHIVGEVQNVGDQAVTLVEITPTFYDSGGVVITTSGFGLTMLSVLLVGEKSPFEIDLGSQPANMSRYDLSVVSSPTSSIPVGLEISSYSSYTDGTGSIHIIGEIRNIATGKASNIKVVATCYGAAGNVTAAALTYLDPEQPIQLDPGQATQFDISLSEERTPYVITYKLTAESREYAAIAEFPILTSILLAFLALAIAELILRKYSVREVSAHANKRQVPIQMSAPGCTHT